MIDPYNMRIPALDYTWEIIRRNEDATYVCRREVGQEIIVTMEPSPLPIGTKFEWINPIAQDFIIIEKSVLTKVR